MSPTLHNLDIAKLFETLLVPLDRHIVGAKIDRVYEPQNQFR
jgi:hypothetical protein